MDFLTINVHNFQPQQKLIIPNIDRSRSIELSNWTRIFRGIYRKSFSVHLSWFLIRPIYRKSVTVANDKQRSLVKTNPVRLFCGAHSIGTIIVRNFRPTFRTMRTMQRSAHLAFGSGQWHHSSHGPLSITAPSSICCCRSSGWAVRRVRVILSWLSDDNLLTSTQWRHRGEWNTRG